MSSWDEQEAFWNTHLDRLADEVGLSADVINSARQQLIVIFGEEWLKQTYKSNKKFKPGDATGIIGLISNPIVNNAVGVVELAAYLKEFSEQPNFDEIVTKLRSTKDFEAIRLNLAYAFRLKRSGWEDVYVEPKLGDIEGKIGGVSYIIECSMIDPPRSASNLANEIFRSVHKVIDREGPPTWINIDLALGTLSSSIPAIIKQVKVAHYKYSKKGGKVKIESEIGTVVVEKAQKSELDALATNMRNSKYDFGWKIEMRKPRISGDVYSVDLDSQPAHESGMLTIRGLINEDEQKTTLQRLREKLKRKKAQTKNVPKGVRRMFIFMSDGKVENEDWQLIGNAFANDIKETDNIDAVVFVDRRHQEFGGKLRYPSGQVHFFTSRTRLLHLEKSFVQIKTFEESDWLGKSQR
jgi:hypothetical protein